MTIGGIPIHLAAEGLRAAIESMENAYRDMKNRKSNELIMKQNEARRNLSDAHQNLVKAAGYAAAAGDQKAAELHSALLGPQTGSDASSTKLNLPCVCINCNKLFTADEDNRLPVCHTASY
jgi:hypothetical protein